MKEAKESSDFSVGGGVVVVPRGGNPRQGWIDRDS